MSTLVGHLATPRPPAGVVPGLFAALTGALGGRIAPERADTTEPPRDAYDPKLMADYASWVEQPGDTVCFARKAPAAKGYLFHDPYNGTRHPGVVKLRLTDKLLAEVGADAIRQLLTALAAATGADHGFFATEADHQRQNLLRRKTRDGGVSEEYVGMTLAKGLPGVYWANWFGPVYDGFLRFDTLPGLAGTQVTRGPAGTLVGYDGPPDAPGLADWEAEVRHRLGADAFFDIAVRKATPRTPWA